MEENLGVIGKLNITLTGPNGQIKEVRELDNLIVQVGKNYLAGGVLGALASPFTNMAIGTGTTAAALGDTALTTEVVRQAFSSSSTALNVATMSATYAPGVGTAALAEAGILNAGTGGILLSHVVFSAVNKGAADTLTITWTITVG
jgi:hypothetical protein